MKFLRFKHDHRTFDWKEFDAADFVTHIREFSEDVTELQKQLARVGYGVNWIECALAWQAYSDSLFAAWMNGAQTGAAWSHVMPWLEPADSLEGAWEEPLGKHIP